MKGKSIVLFLIILAPLLAIGFLYVFGKNNYVVKRNSKLAKGKSFVLGQALGQPKGVALVGLASADTSAAWLQSRVSDRMARIGKAGGKVQYIYLSSDTKPQKAWGAATVLATNEQILAGILHKDLGLAADTGGLGYWYLLLDKNNQVLNAYDLRKEKYLDTLAIETTIMAGAN